MDVTIRPLSSAEDAEAFRALNEQWIAEHFVLEEQDRRQLEDPVGAYVQGGGEVLIAEVDERAVGCVALARAGEGRFELSKMAVDPALRGHGLGRSILLAAVEHARALGARTLYLGSSRRLPDAVHLYEAVGFEHVDPASLHMPYARADVFMAMHLDGGAPPPPAVGD